MIKALHAGCPGWKDDPVKRQEVIKKYKKYGEEVSSNIFNFN